MSTECSKRALIFQGGWAGHQPGVWAKLMAEDLVAGGMEVVVIDSLEPLARVDYLREFALIVPCWTMGQLSPEQSAGLLSAVRSGVGLGGTHGGMGDAFRGNVEYEWMVGGHFLGHPHVGPYTVEVVDRNHAITSGLPESFPYDSEQYYLAVDPAVAVLAESDYTHEGQICRMPVAWTKVWGAGRVFYCALGHDPLEFARHPAARELTRRGLLWAAKTELL